MTWTTKKKTNMVSPLAARFAAWGIVIMALFGCNASNGSENGSNSKARSSTGRALDVREAAVAGQFYPADSSALREQVLSYVRAETPPTESVRMLISPHAGYPFSGPVAGIGYAAIDRDVRTVILIGPPHRYPVKSMSLPEVDAYETPLGRVELDKDVTAKLRESPLVGSTPRAHAMEHCLEVQIPFIQVLLPEAKIVPLLAGGVDPKAAAELLLPLIDDKTLLVCSSDFSHFHDHEKARRLDRRSIETIMSGDEDGFIEACGEKPIRIVMHLAERMGLEPRLLDARDSYETAPPAYKDPGRVVGYASIVYLPSDVADSTGNRSTSKDSVGAGEPDAAVALSDEDRRYLLRLARKSLVAAVHNQPPPEPADVSENLRKECGCFVTLTSGGRLRGCIGYIEGVKPLYRAVIDNARNAALRDHRFPPVKPGEPDEITVEISVLTPPEPLEYESPDDLLRKLQAGKDGIILRKGPHQSTYLPQVWEQLPDKKEFLQRLSRKAGMPPDGWKSAEVKRYRAIHFQEH